MPDVGRQFQQLLAAREEHVSAGSGDVNPLSSQSFGTRNQLMAWRRQHRNDPTPQGIRPDNFGTFNFQEEKQYPTVQGYSGLTPKQ